MMPLIGDDKEDLVLCNPTKYYAAKRDGKGPLLMYPQALVKQTENIDPTWTDPYDMEMTFNSQAPWFFDDIDDFSEKPHEIYRRWNFNCNHSLLVAAAQQLFIGLGFQSRLVSHRNKRNGHEYLTTPLANIAEIHSSYLYFEPPSAFDALLYGCQGSLIDELQQLSGFPKKRLSKPKYLESFESSTAEFSIGQELHDICTNSNLFLNTSNGLLPLYTTNDAGSISKVHPRYNTTKEFVMTPLRKGFTLLDKRNQASLIDGLGGPLIMKTFESMGYSLKGGQFHSFDINDRFGRNDYDPTIS